jgi:hypothetical protein
MKPRSGDIVECVMPLYSGKACGHTFFPKGDQGEVTIVRPYVKGEYIYVRNLRTGEVDSTPLEMFKSHFQIVKREED